MAKEGIIKGNMVMLILDMAKLLIRIQNTGVYMEMIFGYRDG